jgi:hypothetical protein
MADHPLASHALALLGVMRNQEDVIENPPLGAARLIGTETSTFDVPAHKLLQAVIEALPVSGNGSPTIFGGTHKVSW